MTIEAPPAHVHIPPRDGSLLRAVRGVCGHIGREMDPAQELAVDVLTSSWGDMRPASLEAAVCASRQNLKTWCLENIVLTFMTMPGGAKLAVWSAHETATSQESFRTFLDLAERSPWLGDRITHVSRATGREAIEFVGKRWLRFRARIKTGGRGLAGDLIILDEAFALEPAHMGSLLPILSTRPLGRVIYGSSAPLATSDIFRGVIRRGREGGTGAPAYIEWSAPGSLVNPGCRADRCAHAPGTPGCTLDDETMWLRANPGAVYGRISLDYLRAERRALPPEEFARERLGWGEEPGTGTSGFTLEEWARCARADLRESGTPGASPTFAIDLSWDRRHGSIAVASRLDDGSPMVQLVDRPAGSDALVDAAELRARRNPAASWVAPDTPAIQSILGRLRDVGLVPRLLPPREVEAAHGNLQDAVKQQTLVHLGDEDLSVALAGAQRRDTESGWVFTRRRSDVDISPLYAVLSALWEVSQGGPSEVF